MVRNRKWEIGTMLCCLILYLWLESQDGNWKIFERVNLIVWWQTRKQPSIWEELKQWIIFLCDGPRTTGKE